MLSRTATLAVLLAIGVPAAAADKPEPWIEVRSPHFRVISNANDKQARRAAGQFERFREVLQTILTRSRVDSATPMLIIAVKDEKSLKALLPEYWERKGSTHPAGLFLRSMGKNFVVLRLDASGENPYHIIYHEYTHSIMALNFRSLPVWVNEGIAEFFGHASIGDKEAGVGHPDYDQVMLLREHLLPLATLLTTDHRSPYYNEANKTSLFYAQSWALTHYMMIGDKGARQKQLMQYIALVADGVPDVEAAQRAFGDLKQLEQHIDDYIHQATYLYLPVKLTGASDEKQFAVRNVPEAESLAARGDFMMHDLRFTEARALLDEALRLDPKQGLAQESLGFYYYRQNDHEQAARHLAAAVQMDSANFLAHFYYASLSMTNPGGSESDGVEFHLRKAIELNAEFAPAYSALAGYLAVRGKQLDQALELAVKAAKLEPGVLIHHINVANVLLRMERTDEAVQVAQRALASAKIEADRSMIQSFLSEAARYQEFLAQKKRYEEESAAAQKKWEAEKARREQEQKAADEAALKEEPVLKHTPPGKSPGSTPRAQQRRTTVSGKIADVTCGPPAALLMSLTTSDKSVLLHSANYFKIEFYSTGWKPPEDFQPCLHLNGLTVKVTYDPAEGKSYVGEIVLVEVK